ncbi:MAG: FliH/SctL family protein [Myxococcales bacterium]|nr:FliH/SctL family protein [Myxococcales bacterium]
MIRGDTGTGRVLSAEIVDAKLEAMQILERAEQQAAQILERAEEQAAQIEAGARAAGLREGRAQAAGLLLRAERARSQRLSEAEREIVQLGLAAAGKIVRAELALAPEKIREIVGAVLARARRARSVILRVHPDAAAQVRELLDGSAKIELDPSLEPGDCVVSSELGELHAGVETQLEALERALLDELE